MREQGAGEQQDGHTASHRLKGRRPLWKRTRESHAAKKMVFRAYLGRYGFFMAMDETIPTNKVILLNESLFMNALVSLSDAALIVAAVQEEPGSIPVRAAQSREKCRVSRLVAPLAMADPRLQWQHLDPSFGYPD